jgi:hypothetical protein
VTADPAVTGGYRVTLSGGFGQTIAFRDRPARDVAAIPQDRFFDSVAFPDGNPPNAALLTDRGGGQPDLAIVELRNPIVDEDAGTLNYDLQGLADWRSGLDNGLVEEASDYGSCRGASVRRTCSWTIVGTPKSAASGSSSDRRTSGCSGRPSTSHGPRRWATATAGQTSCGRPRVPYYRKGSFGSTYEYWTQQCQAALPEYCSANKGYCQAGDDYNAKHPAVCTDPSGWCHDLNENWN